MRELVSRLQKPTQYLGGEWGRMAKDPAGVRARVALAFPDFYEVGMSYVGGRILYDGHDLGTLPKAERIRMRGQIQMVFQDPYASLNRRMRVRDIIAEPIRYHRLADSPAEIESIVADLLDHVELGASAGSRYPHEFSGGQRQRISVARALATRPRFLICDEPTSALDVSIQAQILNLLKDLQDELGLTMMFISHDLPVIRQMCDRVAVMKNGRMVELAETEQLFEAPQHDYSQHLLNLMPRILGQPPQHSTETFHGQG